MENDRNELKARDAEFRVTLVDGYEFVRPAGTAQELAQQVRDLLSGGYVRETHEDGSITFHLAARVAGITAQRKGTGVSQGRKARARSK
jgi:hypothetical protein